MHSGALAFSENIKSFVFDIDFKEHSLYFDSLIRIVISPTYQEACLLGDLEHDDFIVTSFARPKDLSFYIKQPKSLIDDFFKSPWKIGFLKRLLRLPLPYFAAYKIGIMLRSLFR